MKRLHLVHNGTRIGQLLQDQGGTMRLTAPPVDGIARLSLAFAPSETPIRPRLARAYVEGLLPEGDQVRGATARRFGVSAQSPFALLSAIGHDCPGAVQFLSDEQLETGPEGELVPIPDHRIARRLRDLRLNPAAAWIAEGEHWSLGGAQSKFALRWESGRWHEAHGMQATTHILKPGIIGLSSQALTEHISLRALELVGLNVAHSCFTRFEGEAAIVIERFDRILDDGVMYRVHQEDMCQATSSLPNAKYTVEALQIVTTLRRAGTPEAEVIEFVRAVLANWVLGAPDAHAKNYSVILGPDGLVSLAPLYDVSTGLGFGDYPALAMGIGGEKDFKKITGRHVLEFVRSLGVDDGTAIPTAATMALLMPAAFEAAMLELEHDIDDAELEQLQRVQSKLAGHCQHILTALERTG